MNIRIKCIMLSSVYCHFLSVKKVALILKFHLTSGSCHLHSWYLNKRVSSSEQVIGKIPVFAFSNSYFLNGKIYTSKLRE